MAVDSDLPEFVAVRPLCAQREFISRPLSLTLTLTLRVKKSKYFQNLRQISEYEIWLKSLTLIGLNANRIGTVNSSDKIDHRISAISTHRAMSFETTHFNY